MDPHIWIFGIPGPPLLHTPTIAPKTVSSLELAQSILVLSQYTSITLPFPIVFYGGWSSMSQYTEKGLLWFCRLAQLFKLAQLSATLPKNRLTRRAQCWRARQHSDNPPWPFLDGHTITFSEDILSLPMHDGSAEVPLPGYIYSPGSAKLKYQFKLSLKLRLSSNSASTQNWKTRLEERGHKLKKNRIT